MGSVPKYHHYVLSVIMVLLPALCYSQDFFTSSRATYYSSSDGLGTANGACGLGEYGRTVNYGNVAGVSKLWRNGIGCGACYKVKCTVPQLCTNDGVDIVVTDNGEGENTDFVLSSRAYGGMARADSSLRLYATGSVNVEYKRIPCQFNGNNIIYKVHENSNFPHYLGIVILYVPGEYDVMEVEIWRVDSRDWVPMRRAYGAFFDISNIPKAAIRLRYYLRGSAGVTWAVAKNVIPSDLKAGATYESVIHPE